MPPLAEDTLYYRADHPNGFLFSAGNPEPDPADGWVTAPNLVEPVVETYECSTLAAFQELLRTERAGAADAQDNAAKLIESLQQELTLAREAILNLSEANQSLTDQLTALQPPAGT